MGAAARRVRARKRKARFIRILRVEDGAAPQDRPDIAISLLLLGGEDLRLLVAGGDLEGRGGHGGAGVELRDLHGAAGGRALVALLLGRGADGDRLQGKALVLAA